MSDQRRSNGANVSIHRQMLANYLDARASEWESKGFFVTSPEPESRLKPVTLARLALICLPLLGWVPVAHADGSPVGTWWSFDDGGKQRKAEIVITERDGVLSGRIVRLLDGRSAKDLRCDLCDDERKGAPLAGLEILSNLKGDPDNTDKWAGGQVLDPGSGKVYKVEITVLEHGQQLKVRGYRGVPAFGRTQVWTRTQ